MNKKIKNGNAKLLLAIESTTFDKDEFIKTISQVDDLNEPILDTSNDSTTYLYAATLFNNVEAVKLLLENGADPNYYNENLTCDCALWDLQYPLISSKSNEFSEEMKSKYEIVKLFFQFGADPDLCYEDETFYDCILDKVYNDIGDENWKYMVDLYKLLIIYGGGKGKSRYQRASSLPSAFEYDKIDKYKIKFKKDSDGYHIGGYLYDPYGNCIGRL